jgi:Rha family phage regulatory protein
MSALTIIKQNGGAYIDSRDVAVFIGKDHRNLLRDIRGYCEVMMKSNELRLELINFFAESSYLDSRGRRKLCYLLTKQGCELCANKLSGAKGIMFTAAYVARFNALERAEHEAETKKNTAPRLNEFNSAVKNVLNGMAQCYTAPDGVMKFLRGVYEPLGVEVLPFHETDYYGYYTVTEIAAQIGVYSDTGRPHGHAVSAIVSRIDGYAKHAMVIPYGLVGVIRRYDSFIVEAVRSWLSENNYPSTVPYDGFEYHIYYHRQLSLFDDTGAYTEDELDAFCDEFENCDGCPGRAVCFEDGE